MTNLKSTLSELQTEFPNKDIHIVEVGYINNKDVDATKLEVNTTSTWAFSYEGQAKFLQDLVAALKEYTNVKGLYYWQPEECGNGADTDGKKRVMDDWDNRGFWELTWKSGQHKLEGASSLSAMKVFLSGSDGINGIKAEKKKTDDAWYTLGGQKMTTKPQQKGIFIHQGRKVVN